MTNYLCKKFSPMP